MSETESKDVSKDVSKEQANSNEMLAKAFERTVFFHRLTAKTYDKFLEVQVEVLDIHQLIFYDDPMFLEKLNDIADK